MSIHAAKLSKSERLQAVMSYWGDGKWHSTMETILSCNRTAINSIAAELRKNGFTVECEQRLENGKRSWWYRIPPADFEPTEAAKRLGWV